MSFRDAVRKRKIIAPNRRGFVAEEWQQQAVNLAQKNSDVNLAQAGEWFFKRFEEVRAKHLLVSSPDVNRIEKLRAIVAASNIAMLEMQSHINAQLELMDVVSSSRFTFDDFRNKKLKTLCGASLPSDDHAESIVGGTQKALRSILQMEDDGGRKKASIQAALSDINLAIYYYALEATWERILWEDYELIPGEPTKIRPSNIEQLDAFVATRARYDRLIGSQYKMAVEHFLQENFQPIYTYIRPVIGIVKDGRRQRLVLGEMHTGSQAAIAAFVMRHAVRYQYYGNIWVTESREGLSLDLVLKAWEVVSTASQVLVNRLAARKPPIEDVKANAPVLEIHALCEAIKGAADIPYQVARRLVDFLTYEGKDKDDLWTKPLVRVAADRVAPVLLAACMPELRRAIDIWLADLSIAVEDKGHVFNRHVQEVIAKSAIDSRYLSETKVVIGNFELPIRKDKLEEIDLIIVMGPLVVVGECKCKVLPNEPRDWHKHRGLVRDAAEQIKRKAQAVMTNSQIFVEKMEQRGIDIPANFEALPIVILNTGLHAGIPFNGIPVVDLPILETFFTGYINNGTIEREDGRLDIVPKLSLYSSTQQALQSFTSYLNAPPQLRQLRASIKDFAIPLPMVDDPITPIAILYSREVEIDTAKYVFSSDEI